ncbi:Peptide chain release factor PrfB2, chloroplastic [Turnera subulata]|uniref:Peptide chain release factor PrfB2, chloroplastic n=1 Tax=Turnera subulata TaxID=218843 RepID=A0A9Q0FGP3_9ROSI|nr:Peptide chain release factor PrfB2, chloroplastic [Turnera subulata]
MSSLILKRPRYRSLRFCQTTCSNTHLLSPLASISETQIKSPYSSNSYNSLLFIPNQKILVSGFSSGLLESIKDPTWSHFSGPKHGQFSDADEKDKVLASGFVVLKRNVSGFASVLPPRGDKGLVYLRCSCSYSTQAAAELSTSDGLTVDGIVASNWTIFDESEGDWKSHAAAIAQSIQVIKRRMQWKKLTVRLELLAVQLDKPDLWDDPVNAGRISREHGSLVSKIKEVKAFEQQLLEHIDMIKLAREEGDAEMESESLKALLEMRRNSKEKELEALLSGEQDSCSCYIEVQAGAGGTESMDWAKMVIEMYKSWAQRRGYKVSLVDEMPGDIAGIKRATIKLEGEYAFGYAKAEVGVHRLVRISPFDSGKRRHTSFAAVAVIPILGDGSTRVQINESDLRIERFRSGGPGGQHANTTESAVRIVHIPTGITATSQNERSQHMNKASALEVLQSRLDQLEMTRQAQMNAQHTQSLTEISWGNQIRTYVLHPYRMVKDLRTNYEVSDPDSVLDGEIDGFILNYFSACLDKEDDYP